MARFFIDRPIFAWVLAIIVMLAGILSIATLPIAQYPSIAPPAVAITANYPGASAQTLEDTVTQVIEQKMKGLDHLSYMASTSESSGAVTITLTFDNGTDPDTAQVQVQNKLSLATPLLPQEVQQQGVTVTKSATNFLNVLAFTSEDGSMSDSTCPITWLPTCRKPSAASKAWATPPCSARSTRCGYGWTRTS